MLVRISSTSFAENLVDDSGGQVSLKPGPKYGEEQNRRKSFLHFLRGVLQFEPVLRWSPTLFQNRENVQCNFSSEFRPNIFSQLSEKNFSRFFARRLSRTGDFRRGKLPEQASGKRGLAIRQVWKWDRSRLYRSLFFEVRIYSFENSRRDLHNTLRCIAL